MRDGGLYPHRARARAGTLVKKQWSTSGAAVGMHKEGDFSMSNLDNAEISLFLLIYLLLLSLPISAVNSKPL